MTKAVVKQLLKQLDKNFIHFIKTIEADLKADFDRVVCIDGREGKGKTSFSWWASLVLNKEAKTLVDKYFFLSPDANQVIEASKKIPKFKALVLDEGVKLLYKKDHAKKATKLIEKFYNVNRQDNRLSMINIPRITNLTKYFRNERVMYRIHIVERGIAVVFVNEDFAFGEDSWYENYMLKIKKKWLKRQSFNFLTLEEKLNFYRQAPNYVATLNFPKIPDEYEKPYRELKKKVEMEGIDDEDKKEDEKFKLWKKEGRVMTWLFANTKLQLKDIGELFDCSDRTVIRRREFYAKAKID